MFDWLSGSSTKPPILLKFRSSKTFIILTVCGATFTDIFVYGIVVPVLPFALESRAAIKPHETQKWIAIFLAVYGGALLVAAPVCGWFADRTSSRRMPMILGLLALGGATAMLCVGDSIAVLAVGRVLQGISAAVPWVVGLALLVDTVGPEEIGVVMGYVGISLSMAMLLAPLLGGIVFAQSGYYSVFAMAFGLIALDVFMRVVMIERKVAARWLPVQLPVEEEKVENEDPVETKAEPGIDVEKDAGVTGTATGIPGGQDDIQRAGSQVTTAAEEIIPPDAPKIVKRVSTQGNLPGISTLTEPQVGYRLPPIIFLLASRRVLTSIWGCMIQAALYTGFDSILPLYVRNTFHWNSTGAGLIFLPIVIVSFAGPIVGALADKHGPRWYAAAGYVLACPCLILLRLVHYNSLEQKVLLCALLALIGTFLTLMLVPMMAEIAYAVDSKAQKRPPGFFGRNGAYAQAYALFNVAWAAGCFVGPLMSGLVVQARGWGLATLLMGCVSIFTALPTMFFTGGSLFKSIKERKERRAAARHEDV